VVQARYLLLHSSSLLLHVAVAPNDEQHIRFKAIQTSRLLLSYLSFHVASNGFILCLGYFRSKTVFQGSSRKSRWSLAADFGERHANSLNRKHNRLSSNILLPCYYIDKSLCMQI